MVRAFRDLNSAARGYRRGMCVSVSDVRDEPGPTVRRRSMNNALINNPNAIKPKVGS